MSLLTKLIRLRSRVGRLHVQAALDVAGLGLLSTAAGMWEPVAGVAAAGVSCLLLSLKAGR